MKLNPGRLKHRIKIVQTILSQNENGYWTDPTDRLVHSCWAQFHRTSGKEIYRDNADYGDTEVRFLIRWTAKKINRKMVVLYAGERYEIKYINNYGDSNDYIEIIARLLTLEG